MIGDVVIGLIMRTVILSLLLLCGCHPVYTPTETSSAEIPTFTAQKPIKLALVLGGGGSKGLAHLGAIQELEAAGIHPDLIVGCSAGAMAGALYADGQPMEGLEKSFLPLKRADLLDITYLRPILGLADGKSLQNLMRKSLKAKTFEELKIPLIVVATDLRTGDIIEISQGDIATGVGASCAYPGVFKPVQLFGRHLIDGGASCPVPVAIAKKHGAEKVIAIDLAGKLPESSPRHLFGIGKRSIEIAYRKLVEFSLLQADVVIKMDLEGYGTFSDHLNEQIYETGRQTVRDLLPEIKEKLAED